MYATEAQIARSPVRSFAPAPPPQFNNMLRSRWWFCLLQCRPAQRQRGQWWYQWRCRWRRCWCRREKAGLAHPPGQACDQRRTRPGRSDGCPWCPFRGVTSSCLRQTEDAVGGSTVSMNSHTQWKGTAVFEEAPQRKKQEQLGQNHHKKAQRQESALRCTGSWQSQIPAPLLCDHATVGVMADVHGGRGERRHRRGEERDAGVPARGGRAGGFLFMVQHNMAEV